MSEWTTKSLGEVAAFKKGISYISSDYRGEDDGCPFITIKSFVKGGGYDQTGLKFIRETLVAGNTLREGDVVFAVTDLTRAGDIVGSPLRIPSFGGVPAVASMDCMVLLPVEDVCNKEFLYYRMMLPDVRLKMVAYSAGSTVLHLDTKQVPRIRVSIPKTVSIQQKIARILRTVDRAMEKTEALIEKYQQIKAGLMHDLFTRGLWTQEELDRGDHHGTPAEATAKPGQLRPTRQDAPDLYQETRIGWIPKAWEVKTVESSDGYVTSGARDWAKFYSDDGDIFVRIGNLTREHINFRFDKVQFVSPPNNSDGQRTKLIAGDLLVSVTADLGIVGVIPEGFGDAYINQHIALIRFPQSIVNPRFAGNYMASSPFQKFVARLIAIAIQWA